MLCAKSLAFWAALDAGRGSMPIPKSIERPVVLSNTQPALSHPLFFLFRCTAGTVPAVQRRCPHGFRWQGPQSTVLRLGPCGRELSRGGSGKNRANATLVILPHRTSFSASVVTEAAAAEAVAARRGGGGNDYVGR